MASVTVKVGNLFPAAATVGAYATSLGARTPEHGAPPGSPVSEAVVAEDGSLTATGLTAGTEYILSAEVGGAWRYLRVQPDAAAGNAWLALTATAKLEATVAIFARAALTLDTARLRGRLTVKAGKTLTAGEALFTLPESLRPPQAVTATATTTSGAAVALDIPTTGIVTCKQTLTGAVSVALDGVTWNLT